MANEEAAAKPEPGHEVVLAVGEAGAAGGRKREDGKADNDRNRNSAAPPADNQGDQRDDQDAEINQKVRSRHASFQTTILGGVHAQNVTIGGESQRDYRTGPLDDRKVRDALRYFHPPVGFEAAETTLRTDNVVLLCGPEGSGRRCAALKLLDDLRGSGVPDGRLIEILAPATPIAALLDRSFELGGRYLLADQIHAVDDGQARFEIDQLQHRLKAANAFLIVTTEAPAAAFGSSATPWQPTTAAAAFEAHVTVTSFDWTDEQAATVRRVVAAMPLSRLTEFITKLRTHGPDAACAPFGDPVRSEFREWLDGRPPEIHGLVPVTAAALLPGAVEWEHETRAVALSIAVDTRARRDRAAAPARHMIAVRPSRRSRAAAIVRRSDRLWPGGHVIAVTDDLTARIVLDELHERYGDELWMPIRTWLHDLPLKADLPLLRSLAEGVAVLAQVDLGLADRVMDAWASDRDDDRRWVAALTNSALCGDGLTVSRALNRAVRWSRGSQQSKITAAHAFGLSLSVHVPGQAISRLWNLTFGDAVVAIYARAELMAVVRRAMTNDGLLSRVLAIIVHQLDYLLANVSTDDGRIDRALTTIVRLLAVRRSHDVPLTVVVLRVAPDSAPPLAHLWAQVLQSWQHRVAAIDELHAAYTGLDTSTAAALGDAIHHELGAVQWQWLCRDLGVDICAENEATEVVQ